MDGTTVEAIRKLADEANGKTVLINGIHYSTTALHDPRRKAPQAEPLTINTLQGIVDYLRSELDKEELKDVAIQVVNEDAVRLVSALQGIFRQRETYVVVENNIDEFPFDQFLDHEKFMINMMTRVLDDQQRADVLKVIGTIKDESVRTVEDDGVSQTVAASAGIVRTQDVVIPNPVELRPYRTFREVEQPSSPFILRARRGNEGELPTLALFEADGGAWALKAVENIRAWLNEKLPQIPIIA